MTQPLLELREVSLAFGGLKAVDRFNLQLMPGQLQGLIGPNGAGKTTIFNLVTGVYRPDSGQILLDGQRIAGLSPHNIARAGITRTFQNIRLFPNLSVLDNVRVACHVRATRGLVSAILRTRPHRGEERAIAQRAMDLLRIFNLDGRAEDLASGLPYGDQRRLEIARALASEPRVLLLDEPAAGMNSREKVDLAALIRDVRQRFNLTILLIDHDVSLIMGICDRITVLDYGQIIAAGVPRDIQSNPAVIEAYLGEPPDSAPPAAVQPSQELRDGSA